MTPSEIMLHNADSLRPFIAAMLVYAQIETSAGNWITAFRVGL
jgi:hypothetical protein